MLKIFSRMHWHREAERVVEMKLSRQGCVLSSLMFTLKHIMELDNDVGTDGELHPPQRRQRWSFVGTQPLEVFIYIHTFRVT
jgi:hypothetical protein